MLKALNYKVFCVSIFRICNRAEYRKEAHKLLGHIAVGRNLAAEKKQKALQGTTQKQVFDDSVKTRKNLKERTLYDYRRLMTVAFINWQDKAITSISKDMVAKQHRNMKMVAVMPFCGKIP